MLVKVLDKRDAFAQLHFPVLLAALRTLEAMRAGPRDDLLAIDLHPTAVMAGGAKGVFAGFVDAQVRAFGSDYRTLLDIVRARASGAKLVILNVPNAAGMPYLAGTSLAQRQAAQRAAVGMTRTVVNPLASANTIVIDLMCDARSYQASTYSSDGLHPSDAGYAFIAAEVVRAITTTNYPAPLGSCSANTIVP